MRGREWDDMEWENQDDDDAEGEGEKRKNPYKHVHQVPKETTSSYSTAWHI